MSVSQPVKSDSPHSHRDSDSDLAADSDADADIRTQCRKSEINSRRVSQLTPTSDRRTDRIAYGQSYGQIDRRTDRPMAGGECVGRFCTAACAVRCCVGETVIE